MQDTITQLTEKCEQMDKSIKTNLGTNAVENSMKDSQKMMDVKQNTIAENINSRFDVIYNKLKYQEVLFHKQKW